MRELVLFITRSLVDSPDEVEVTEVAGERGIVLQVKVAPDDVARLLASRVELLMLSVHLSRQPLAEMLNVIQSIFYRSCLREMKHVGYYSAAHYSKSYRY